MPFRLTGLTVDRVDLVPRGANPDAHIVLFKSKEGHVPQSQTKTKKKVAKKTPKPDTRKKQQQRGEDEDDEEEEDDAVQMEDDDEEDEDLADDEEDEVDEEDEEDDDEPPVKKKTVKSKKKPAKAPAKKRAAKSQDDEDDTVVDEDEDLTDDVEDDDEEDDDVEANPEMAKMLKSLAGPMRKTVESLLTDFRELKKSNREARKVADEAKKTAAVEKERRERSEYIEKAKTSIGHLPGTDVEKGEMLQALYSGQPVDRTIAKTIHKLLKAGDKAMASALFTERGSRDVSDDEQSAVDDLREKAAAIQKADTKLTKEQAFEKACQLHPSLFQAYRDERNRVSRRNN